jgi:hypothetical protein
MDIMYPDDSSASSGSTNNTGSLNGVTSTDIEQTTVFGTPLLPYAPVNMITKIITASSTVVDSPSLLMVDASAGAVTITLPTGGSGVGKLVAVMKTDSSAFTVTINAASGETVYKLSSFSNLSSQYQAAMFIGIKFSSFNGWVKVA